MIASDIGSWVAVRVAGLARFLPGVVLGWRYPVPRLRERIAIFCRGVGPHLVVSPSVPAKIQGLSLTVFNRLPFPIEMDGLQAQIVLESQVLGTCTWVGQVAIEPIGIGTLQIQHDLTDSQAQLIRAYPAGQQPFDCPILRIHGEIRARTSFRVFTVSFGCETRAFVYRRA